MTLTDFKTIINGTGLSTIYFQWPEGEVPALPFVCWFEEDTDNYGADNIVYVQRHNIAIELYARNRDLTSEGLIETALETNSIFWDKEITFLDDEKCYETIYKIQI